MKIGIYGGTFNPPHKGHGKVMEAVIASLGLEELWLIPTKTPPHKTLGQDSASPSHRLEMVSSVGNFIKTQRRRSQKEPCPIRTLDVEIRREGISYTVDTLQGLREEHPDGEFWLILGEDMLLHFMEWKEPETVAKLANLCTFVRSDQAPSPALLSQAQHLRDTLNTQVEVITLEGGIAVSSTEIRESLAQGVLSSELYPTTVGQIIRHKLYGVEKDLTSLDAVTLRDYVFGYLKAKRCFHTIGVEQECIKLAKRWGEDETLARRAGILHDITKYWTHEQHLAFCDQYQYPLEAFERGQVKLLHAKSGAVYAKEIFQEEEAIWRAIDCHTTGKGNMSLLDKILYIADYIEVNRDFEELEEMRALAYEDLDKALGFGLDLAMAEMIARNKETDHNTLEAHAQYGSTLD